MSSNSKRKDSVRRAACLLLCLAAAAASASPAAAAETQYESDQVVKFTDISLGADHGGAVSDTGYLYTWGYNNAGQLGNGEKRSSWYTPARVKDKDGKVLSGVVQASMGGKISAAVTKSNNLYIWGDSKYLGYPVTDNSNLKPSVLRYDDARSVSLGYQFGSFVTTDDDIYVWGRNNANQLGTGNKTKLESDAIKLLSNTALSNSPAFTDGSSAFVSGDNELFVCGANSNGQLGTGDTNSLQKHEKIMDGIEFVDMGYNHSAAITTNGELYLWGSNKYGQLGDGTFENSFTPKLLDKAGKENGVRFIDVSVGENHTAAITKSGDLYVWGADDNYQLGDNNKVRQPMPRPVMQGTKFKKVSLNKNGCAAITEDGRIFTWGYNDRGILGYQTDGDWQTEPKELVILLYNLLGDLDDDGELSANDANEILRLSAKQSSAYDDGTERTKAVSDYDKDGVISSDDALIVLRESVGYHFKR